jgi:hypothetical protein
MIVGSEQTAKSCNDSVAHLILRILRVGVTSYFMVTLMVNISYKYLGEYTLPSPSTPS